MKRTGSDPRAGGGPAGSDTIHGVERAVEVLEFLSSQQRCGPSEISRTLHIAKPTVLRILRTWRSLGYVTSADGSYEVGWKLFALANARGDARELQSIARRYLLTLNEISGETVNLSVVDGQSVLYVDKIEGRRNIRVYGSVGKMAPMYATASGKALLAHLQSELLGDITSTSMTRWTPATLSGRTELERDLADTLRRGYSVNRGEWHTGVGGVGAAVYGRHGDPEAALSISFPLVGVDERRIEFLGKAVRDAALSCSRDRGWVDQTKPRTLGTPTGRARRAP